MNLLLLLPRRNLVDFIQSQLALISSSTSITCTTAKLAPLRGALQAAVALHAIVIVHEGLRTEKQQEVARMVQYLREIIGNDSYLRILPEPVLALFVSVEDALQKGPDHDSFTHPCDHPHETTRTANDHPSETSPIPSEIDASVSPLSNTRTTTQDGHPPITIIIDESLLQQRELLQYAWQLLMIHRTLEVQHNISYICRSVRPISMIVDIDTGVFLTSLAELQDPAHLRSVVDSLAGETVRYDRLIVVIETQDSNTREISTPLQCLLAGIMFFPVETMIHFSSVHISSSHIEPALSTQQAIFGSASTHCTYARPCGE